MCDGVTLWATTDALGIGGLLVEAGHLAELIATGDLPFDELLPRLLTDAERSLEYAMNSWPAQERDERKDADTAARQLRAGMEA